MTDHDDQNAILQAAGKSAAVILGGATVLVLAIALAVSSCTPKPAPTPTPIPTGDLESIAREYKQAIPQAFLATAAKIRAGAVRDINGAVGSLEDERTPTRDRLGSELDSQFRAISGPDGVFKDSTKAAEILERVGRAIQ